MKSCKSLPRCGIIHINFGTPLEHLLTGVEVEDNMNFVRPENENVA